MRLALACLGLLFAVPVFGANRVKDNLQWGMLTREGKEALRSRNYADAERKMKQAMAVAVNFGDTDPKGVAVSKENLAQVYLEQKIWKKAEPLLLDAIYLRERQQDVDPAEIAAKLEEIGDFFVRRGKPAKSEAWFQKAVQRLDGALDPDYHWKGAVILKLGTAQLLNRKNQAAHDSFVKSRETYAKSPEGVRELEDQRFLAKSLSGQASALAALGKHVEAKLLHLKAVAVADKNFPGDAFVADMLEAATRDIRKADKVEAAKLDIRAKEIRRGSFE